MKDERDEQMVSRLILAAIAMLALPAIIGILTAAPAPLPRREQPIQPCPLPRRCVMVWYGQHWDAEFYPNGAYRCSAEGRTLWVGTWRLEGWVLTIRERYVRYSRDPENFTTYKIRMHGCLRRGVIMDSGKFLLIEPRH